MVRQKRLNRGSQRSIAAALFRQHRRTMFTTSGDGHRENGFDSPLTCWIHADGPCCLYSLPAPSSLWSQARAKLQSFLTVATETPSVLAVSAIVSPAK